MNKNKQLTQKQKKPITFGPSHYIKMRLKITRVIPLTKFVTPNLKAMKTTYIADLII